MVRTVVSVGLPVVEKMNIMKNHLEPVNKTGNEKRFCLVTGVHGDELEGQYVCYSLIKKINENIDKLKGIVDVYPCVNPLGMESVTRRIPTFDLDMNRTFPGDEEGDMAEYAAAKLIDDILGADFCLDLHASNIFLREVPQVRLLGEHTEGLIEYAKLVNTEFIWIHSSPTVKEASLYHCLNEKGVPTISIEMGVGMRITKEYGDRIVDGIFCILKKMGIWDGETIEPVEPVIASDVNNIALLHANEPGIFLPHVDHWDDIKKGSVIGEVVSSFTGEILESIVAPFDGKVFTLREFPVVYAGSLLARVLGNK